MLHRCLFPAMERSFLSNTNKSRTIVPVPYLMKLLQAQKVQQAK